MARSYRNLWPQVVSWENLLAAYRECRRRKRYKRAAVVFDFAWETHLLNLNRALTDGSYEPGTYTNFYVHEPKKRKISAAPFRDRVVHHAVVRVIQPIYERRFVYDSYACRKGKGTHRAVARAHHYLRRYKYYLKTDIVRFFPNVDHQLLVEQIARTIRDERLLELIRKIIRSGEGVLSDEATADYFPGDDLFAVLRPQGLPIGNLTSQFFANVLLDPIDHFVKEELRTPGYVRYADDLVLFADSKSWLWDAHDALRARLAGIRLRLHTGKTQIRPSHLGLKFLGLILNPSGRRLQQTRLKRFNRRIRHLRWQYQHGWITAVTIRQSIKAWLAHASQANSAGIKNDIWKRLRFQKRHENRQQTAVLRFMPEQRGE